VTVHAVVVDDDHDATAQPVHDWIAVLDEAQSVSAHALAAATAILAGHPSVGTVFIGADARATDRAGTVVAGDRWLLLAASHGPDAVGGRCAVLRRSTFQGTGPLALGTRSAELKLWLRAAALADVAFVAEPLNARSHEPDLPAFRPGQVTELHERALAFHELFEGFAPLLSRPRLRSAAYRAIARRARARSWVATYERDRVESALCRHLAHEIDQWRRSR
jgi:hypothetical protein